MTPQPNIWAVVPAAGIGRRFGADIPKQYADLHVQGNKVSVLHATISALIQHASITGLIVVLAKDDPYWTLPDGAVLANLDSGLSINSDSPNQLGEYSLADKPMFTVCGGAERADSVFNALTVLSERVGDDDWVLVHDAARPCLRIEDLDRLITACMPDATGGLLASPVADTLKRQVVEVDVDANDGSEACKTSTPRVERTIAREYLWRALTPQMFRLGRLKKALPATGSFTDEASAIEALGYSPKLIEGHSDNIKITTKSDLQLAQAILNARTNEKT